jgi:hypothetical protein
MFATTIEYVLKTYTEEYALPKIEIGLDGSMETFDKEFHPVEGAQLREWLDAGPRPNSITTPIYPFPKHEFSEILEIYGPALKEPNKAILVHAGNMDHAELNMLFQHHKIAYGQYRHYGLDFFFGDNRADIVQWNSNYQHWRDMKPWELREWFSLFYSAIAQKWINSRYQIPDYVLPVTNQTILDDTLGTFQKIIKHCGLTEKSGLDEYSIKWRQAQQYIVDEFLLLDQIIKHTVEKQPFVWHDLNIFAESIIQRRLRELGYEIRCDGLDIFPTDSETLANLLERV